MLTFVRSNGFNALRVPFAAELALNPNKVAYFPDPALSGLTNMARLAKFVDLAAAKDLLVSHHSSA